MKDQLKKAIKKYENETPFIYLSVGSAHYADQEFPGFYSQLQSLSIPSIPILIDPCYNEESLHESQKEIALYYSGCMRDMNVDQEFYDTIHRSIERHNYFPVIDSISRVMEKEVMDFIRNYTQKYPQDTSKILYVHAYGLYSPTAITFTHKDQDLVIDNVTKIIVSNAFRNQSRLLVGRQLHELRLEDFQYLMQHKKHSIHSRTQDQWMDNSYQTYLRQNFYQYVNESLFSSPYGYRMVPESDEYKMQTLVRNFDDKNSKFFMSEYSMELASERVINDLATTIVEKIPNTPSTAPKEAMHNLITTKLEKDAEEFIGKIYNIPIDRTDELNRQNSFMLRVSRLCADDKEIHKITTQFMVHGANKDLGKMSKILDNVLDTSLQKYGPKSIESIPNLIRFR